MGRAGTGRRRGKLTAGCRVALLHPEWDRPCAACERFVVQADGSAVRDRRTGLPMLRPKGVPTPCGQCEKVPAWARRAGLDVPELRKLAVEMTPRNRAAWRFYRECRAVGAFPDDPLVRWAAVLIRDVEDAASGRPVEQLTAVLSSLTARR